MTTKVTVQVFETIGAEHLDLNRKHEELRAFLQGTSVPRAVLRRRLAELAAALHRHFEHEEQEGYFTEIVELAPRLSHQADALEHEHETLLQELQQIDNRVAAADENSEEYALLCRELGEFIDACCDHEHRETALVQEAWFTEIGTGD